MKIITSHIGNDFDSLASMIAATKLHDGAIPCFSGSASRSVREFLKRYPGRWTILTPRKVKLEKVTELIIVDARSRSRIGPFASLVDKKDIIVSVYDHHPSSGDDIKTDFALIEPVGATITLLLELMLERKISISPQEATLFAMGIYEDTGGLTFGATNRRDFEMVCRMRELGADFSIIPSSIDLSLSAPERRILDQLMENAWERYIHGAKVVLTYTSSPRYVDGLSLFVHRVRDYFDADVAIASVRMDRRTYVVARGREDVLNVAEFLRPLGGGGHPQASSVTLHNKPPHPLLIQLEKSLEQAIKPIISVEDVMTSPVMAVQTDSLVDDAYRIMIRYGHSALPVMEGSILKGIITRKDLDKAQLHGYGHVMVVEFMTEGVITVSLHASISEAHRILVTYNIGRLPVMDGTTLKGIVSRTDLLRALYPVSIPIEERSIGSKFPWTEDLSEDLSNRLDPGMRTMLHSLGHKADHLKMKAYVVGGVVRDLLLGRENLDLDIVIEGDIFQYVHAWDREGCRVAIHNRFRTGTVVFPNGRKVDVATARREFYEYPVAQPTVSSDSLKHDLYRRDFTVNAMAISINQTNWGILVDYFGGRRDLKEQKLKVLHNLSFVEDPTRILRGIRLEQRLKFNMEDNTLRLLKNCVKGGLLSHLSGVRLRSEVELSFLEKHPYPILQRMQELGVWKQMFPGIRIAEQSMKTTRRLSALLNRFARDFPDFGPLRWLAYLGALVLDSASMEYLKVIDRLGLSQRERRIVERALLEFGAAENELGGRGYKKNSEIYAFLKEFDFVTSIFWAAATDRWRVRKRIMLYLTRLHRVCPMLTGKDIIELGYEEGSVIGRILEDLLYARLDGSVETREDEFSRVQTRFPRNLMRSVNNSDV